VAIFVGGLDATIVDVGLNLLQSSFGSVEIPGVARGILLHLEGRSSDATRIRCLTRGENDAGVLEGMHRLRSAGHVGTFSDSDHTVADEGGGSLTIELVLSGTGQGDATRLLSTLTD